MCPPSLCAFVQSRKRVATKKAAEADVDDEDEDEDEEEFEDDDVRARVQSARDGRVGCESGNLNM